MRKIVAAVGIALAALAVGAAPATAQEDTRMVLRPGDGITFSSADPSPGWCSVAAVGRDRANRLVALTAGHCFTSPYVTPGTTGVWKANEAPKGRIGTMTTVFSPGSTDWFGFPTNAKPDYGVIVLDETKVRGSNSSEVDAEGQSVTVNATRPAWNTIGNGNIGAVCNAGYTTKIHCSEPTHGIIVGSNLIQAYPSVGDGDSGGALVDNQNQLVGIAVGYYPGWPPNVWQRIDKVLLDLENKASYGAGFVPVSTA